MSWNSVLFHHKDDIAVLITDVEPAKMIAEVVDVVNLTHQRRCRERLLARHCQGLLLHPLVLYLVERLQSTYAMTHCMDTLTYLS